jgi:hypothetical protein
MLKDMLSFRPTLAGRALLWLGLGLAGWLAAPAGLLRMQGLLEGLDMARLQLLFAGGPWHRVGAGLQAEFLPGSPRLAVARYLDARTTRAATTPRDVDLTASTDTEDAAAFVADVLEFTQQGQVLAADAMADALSVGLFGGAVATLARLGSWRARRR